MEYTPLIAPNRPESPEIHNAINGDPSYRIDIPVFFVPGEMAPKKMYAPIGCILCVCVTLSVAAFVLYKLGMLTSSE
jgi:hypothetical protein